MEKKIEKPLASAILKILRRLVRILLRNGVSFRSFEELAKWAYVDVAMREFGIEGKQQSVSRVSIITGLSRKEVSRLWKMETALDTVNLERYNRASRVISGWTNDSRFCDSNGHPMDLPFDVGEATFSDLVKVFSGDATPRAVLDELLRVGTTEIRDNGNIRLISEAYVPFNDAPGLLSILGTDVAHLISTIDHNITGSGEQPFFQRKVSYDNLPAEALCRFRQTIKVEGQQLLEKLNRQLHKQDRDVNPLKGGTNRFLAGVGIYYFEEPFGEAYPDPKEKRGGRK